ncbi:uncharacterized protein L969DRAFT_60909 [Mixia osmundae IAM 14324]|uniref:Metallo-beta-lactamase domain-containing protein n=1 Tax=Mixia osmundae (strain CBS 9802 / IAM 14324 / JCM 22182 / KY 12970) TaxID=764103 RepID=G7E9W4_MIXOS|nr:uncharacterized protein L969DRAFT_60909 [Mixia osmundae IAM 14324]KEI40067.1 hypothetical protein L969DRAFT_60909 [Mixia osmundae IAM 14324]GAA99433.1 hypothetical protein E5Q_06132 [Mixia osmundae IAM 14324]
MGLAPDYVSKLPAASDAETASKINVFDGEGGHQPFGKLVADSKTVVVFIRHFRCGMCQQMVSALSAKHDVIQKSDTKLVIIGQGDYKLIKPYTKLLECPYPIYADPTKKLYTALGMTVRNLEQGAAGQPRKEYLTHGQFSGLMLSITNAFKMGQLTASSGDIKQQGGEFIFENGSPVWAHRMTTTSDHSDVAELLKAANISAQDALCHHACDSECMSTFEGYFDEFEDAIKYVRADRFTTELRPTSLHLLSHVHSDHTVGLANTTGNVSSMFQGRIVCSAITKDLLLHLMPEEWRILTAEGYAGGEKVQRYPFSHLRRNIRGRPHDCLRPIELDERHRFELHGHTVDVTLIDANHCPGSTMMLIEQVEPSPVTVLYTGDIRAEPDYLETLREHPILREYALPSTSDVKGKRRASPDSPRKTLDRIYLDTAASCCTAELLPKQEAVEQVLSHIARFPAETIFFLNAWTWGYELLVEAVAERFNTRIHVDAYKFAQYSRIGLGHLVTLTESESRFHACERRWKCDTTWVNGRGCRVFAQEVLPDLSGSKRKKTVCEETCRLAHHLQGCLNEDSGPHVVYVNPWECSRKRWQAYKDKVELDLQRAEQEQAACSSDISWPANLVVPIARHSTHPELHSFVALFRPKALYPNTIYPSDSGLDYLAMATLYGDVLAPGGTAQLEHEAREHIKRHHPDNVYLDGMFGSREVSLIMDDEPHFGRDYWASNFEGSTADRWLAAQLLSSKASRPDDLYDPATGLFEDEQADSDIATDDEQSSPEPARPLPRLKRRASSEMVRAIPRSGTAGASRECAILIG